MENGYRIPIYECIDAELAWRCYNHEWMAKNAFVKGKQYPGVYFCRQGYCSWNMSIGCNEYLFDKAFKKIATFVIQKVHQN